MRSPRLLLRLAAGIATLTTFIHLFAGQLTLVQPLLDSNLRAQESAEWLSVWHMGSWILALSSFFLWTSAGRTPSPEKLYMLRFISLMFLGFGLVFLIVTFVQGQLLIQWALLLPVAALTWRASRLMP